MLGTKSPRVFPTLTLKDPFTGFDGTFEAKGGGSGKTCPTTS